MQMVPLTAITAITEHINSFLKGKIVKLFENKIFANKLFVLLFELFCHVSTIFSYVLLLKWVIG